MAGLSPCWVGGTSTSTGSGDVTMSGTLGACFRTMASYFSDGQTFFYMAFNTVANLFEEGLATWHASSTSYTRTTIISNSSNTTSAISWPTGTITVFCSFPSTGQLQASNNLSDLVSASTARTNLGLSTAAVTAMGTSNGNIVQVGASGLPALGATLLTSLPGILPAPSGTKILCFNNAAPTGWTVSAAVNDSVIGVTDNNTGAGHPAGGSTTGSTWDNSSGITVAAHALTPSEAPGFALAAYGNTGGAQNVVIGYGFTNGTAHVHTLSSTAAWRPPTLNGINIVKS